MPPALAALLCLGLCLSRRISTQTQTLSKPTIWAKPDFMVPKGKPVAIWCRGAPKAAEFQLYFEGSLSAVERPRTPGPLNQVKFLISAMSSQTAGQYSCSYWTGELWSEPSHTLDLVVTGMYEDEDDVPTLSVLPGPEVTSGDSVTFCCHLQTATSTFFLVKEGRPSHVQKKHGTTRAEFPVGLVTTAHQGTYRCFGSYNNHAWSLPSKPVKLVVTGVENTSRADPTSSPADSPDPSLPTAETGFQEEAGLWDHTSQNLLRIGLAYLVLVALVVLLTEDWAHRKRTREGASGGSSDGSRTRSRTRRPRDAGAAGGTVTSVWEPVTASGAEYEVSPPRAHPRREDLF